MNRAVWCAGVALCFLSVRALAGWVCDGARQGGGGDVPGEVTVYYSNENIDRCGSSGVFDENVFSPATIQTVVGATSLEGFRAAIASAWSNDLGGVINWETGVEYARPGVYGNGMNWLRLSGIVVDYGESQTKTIKLVFSDVSSMELYNWKTFSSLSGDGDGRRHKISTDASAADPSRFTLSFAYTNGAAWPLVAVGVGVVTAEPDELEATAFFSDLTHVTYTNRPTDDGRTLFHFEATASQTITSVTFRGTSPIGAGRIVVDDIGFIGAAP